MHGQHLQGRIQAGGYCKREAAGGKRQRLGVGRRERRRRRRRGEGRVWATVMACGLLQRVWGCGVIGGRAAASGKAT